MKKTAVPLLFLFLAAAACGQSALDGFDPNANGPIRVAVVQPDGKILLGGEFTTLSPNGGAAVTRNRIARLNPDGTLDAAFDPNATAPVYAIAVQADGKILVGGSFDGPNGIGGQPRNNIARLEATTGLADSFNPNANGFVVSIAVQEDGKILAGGLFTSMGGQPRNNIARLDAATGSADSWDPNANSLVRSIVVQTDGKILVGGWFNGANSIGGQARNRIARLDPATGLADSFDPNAHNIVYSIAVQADGKILAGGSFSGANSIGGQTRNFIARLDATTGLADSFDPNANSSVSTIAVQADGKILASGGFTQVSGQLRNRIARLDPATGLADSFDPNANGVVESMAVQADGKVVAIGYFNGPNSIGGQTRNHIARLETDGRLDQTFDISVVGVIPLATAVQPDGKILIGGQFSSVLGVSRNNIARLNTDGTLDAAFNPNANHLVWSIAVQADGKILASGAFTSIGGQMRHYFARLDPTTGLADSFDPTPNNGIASIVTQADGKILVGGGFTSIGGQLRNRIARLDSTTGLVDSFDPNANHTVQSIAVQADGKILAAGSFNHHYGAITIGGQLRNRIARLDPMTGLADSFNPDSNDQIYVILAQPDGQILGGGFFTNIGGQTRHHIVRLDATTGLADSFDPNGSDAVVSIAVQGDGKVLAGGSFASIGGQTRNRIARLDPATGLVDSFDPNANGTVYSNTLQTDGKILVNGYLMTAVGGQTRNHFARLTNDTAALQNLSVTQTTLTWTRGGSSPQFTRVTFESSNDNVNYAPLGNGVAVGSNWTLTGLNLPTGQNLYIRGRGYYRGGYQNGSESIAESVRNAFLTGPTGTPTPAPTPTATVAPTPTPSPSPTATATATATPTTTATATPTPPVTTPTPTPSNTPSPTPTPTPGVCSWSAAPVLPVSIFANAVTSVGGNLYSFGGATHNVFLTNSYKFNGATWTTIAPLPVGLVGASAVTDGTNIFIVGGRASTGSHATLYKYDPATNAYTTLAPVMTPTSFQAAGYLNGKIYKFCGTMASSGFTTPALEIYDVATNTWAAGTDCPTNAYFVSSFVHGNFIYAAGGFSTTPIAHTAKTYRYDPATNTWNDAAIADLPEPRAAAAAAFYNGGGVLAGGRAGDVVAATISPSVISWDPTSNTWSNLPNMLGERSIINGAVLNGSFYVVGGDSNVSPSTNDNQKLTCPPATPPTPTPTSTPTPPPASPTPTPSPAPAAQAINLSTRMRVQTGDNVGIGGFIITGTAPKHVLLRAIGPSLTLAGVPDALANPVLELHGPTGFVTMTNDNWQDDPVQKALIEASGIPPTNDFESAIDATLAPGAYTAIVRGNGNTSGVALVEVYDLDASVASKLANISTRALVGTGDNVVIAGFMLGGNPPQAGNDRVVVRGIGPSLGAAGVPNALADPTLELRNSDGALVDANNDWQDDAAQAAELSAAGLAPTNPLESGIAATLPPGLYTALLGGLNSGTGIGVVEVYDRGAP